MLTSLPVRPERYAVSSTLALWPRRVYLLSCSLLPLVCFRPVARLRMPLQPAQRIVDIRLDRARQQLLQ